jgi:tetratricopeptide (TPR) repeat protein
LLALGRFDEAATAVEAGLKLDPRDSQTGFWLALLAFAHYLAGRHALAAECARAAIRRRASPGAFLALAAASGHLCRPAEAAAALAKYHALAVRRPAVAGCSPFVSLNYAKRVVEGLEKVGLSSGGAARRCASNAAAELWTERVKERAHPLASTPQPVEIGPPDAAQPPARRLGT